MPFNGKAQREKYSRTMRGILSKVIHVNMRICEGGMIIRWVRENWEAVKALT